MSSAGVIDWGRETCGNLSVAEGREWLCTNGMGGFASGTVAGLLTRRYHGLLVAALAPPLGRTLLVTKVDDSVVHDGVTWSLFVNRWAGEAVNPHGYRQIERFRLEGMVPVWTYACADALLEKRVWMEDGENTTYVHYDVVRAPRPLTLELKALVNYRDYHGATHANGWQMRIEPVADGLRVVAFDGARPFVLRAGGAEVAPAHSWYTGFDRGAERGRGLDDREDHLHAGTFRATLAHGQSLTLVLSAEARRASDDLTDATQALTRRRTHEAALLSTWEASHPAPAPAWIRHLVLAADQFVVRRPRPEDPGGMTVIAGYHWFGDWGRDTMISLPGLALTTGRPEVAARILRTFAAFVDRGMLPNRFPDRGEAPEYNTVDATLWYFEAIRAYVAATGDDGLLKDLLPVLESIVDWHERGTRHGIRVDARDGLLASGEEGVQLTWMDARVGDWVVTPRRGKPVEINALWYNALRAMTGFARHLGRPTDTWDARARRVAAGFARFWAAERQHCYDVLDTPDGHDDDALRPNQILAVSLPETPLSPEQQRKVVDACGRHLLTSYGLRSLAPGHPDYCSSCAGDARARDGAYHQGTVWSWLLGPFALAHFKVHGDRDAARALLLPMAHHLADYGVGSIGEIFDGDAPFAPRGCIAQAWGVAETLRAWHALAGSDDPRPRT